MNLIEKIEKIENLYKMKGCSTEEIVNAEKELNLNFSKDYKEYLEKFGSISFYATEWTGLNIGGVFNVVIATKQERELSEKFPKDYFLIENIAVDNILIIGNEKGEIYSYQNGKKEILCKNLLEYLDICIKRGK